MRDQQRRGTAAMGGGGGLDWARAWLGSDGSGAGVAGQRNDGVGAGCCELLEARR